MNVPAPVEAGSTVSPAVRVGDHWGNGVAGATVTFTLMEGGGFVSGPQQVTDADGLATIGSWTVGTELGEQRLAVTADSVPGDTLVLYQLTVPAAVVELTLLSGDNQLGETGQPLLGSIVVAGVDRYGHPAWEQPVFAEVLSGGGSVERDQRTLEIADGTSVVGPWTLGPEEGQQRLLVYSGSDSLVVTATAEPVDYDIELRFERDVTPTQRAAFEAARDRWESVIAADLPMVRLGDICLFRLVRDTVDDLVVFVDVNDIDGRGGEVASSEPCGHRHPHPLPSAASMRIDRRDLEVIEAQGLLEDFVTHEMGHALGLGRLWSTFSLVVGPGSIDPFYVGSEGRRAFAEVGGGAYTGNPVPLAVATSSFGEEHWRDTVFGAELMSEVLEPGVSHPLSIVTIAALQDLGYEVNRDAADAYTLPPPD